VANPEGRLIVLHDHERDYEHEPTCSLLAVDEDEWKKVRVLHSAAI
jgi:hypothetical protein